MTKHNGESCDVDALGDQSGLRCCRLSHLIHKVLGRWSEFLFSYFGNSRWIENAYWCVS